MPEFSFSTTKPNDVSALLFHLCFSIFSHPLYFSYFLFFSPYILKLVSFLSPLFVTTTLLLLALLTVSPNFLNSSTDSHESPESKPGFLLSGFHSLMKWLQSNEKDEEIGLLDEVEAYLVMFQASIFQAKPEEGCAEGFDGSVGEEAKSLESLFRESEESEDCFKESTKSDGEMKVLESLFQEDESEFHQLVQQKEENEEGKEKIVGLRSGLSVKVLRSFFQEKEDSKNLGHQKEENEQQEDSEPRKYSEEEENKGKLGLISGSRVIMGDNRNLNSADSEDLVHQKEENEGKPKQEDSEQRKLSEEEENKRKKMGLRSGFRVMMGNNRVFDSADSEDLVHQKEENEDSELRKFSEESGGKLGMRSGFRGTKLNTNNNNSKSQRVLEASLGSPENNWVYSEPSNLGSFGSMRREKEWRRTLACKLFEERHSTNVKGIESEGMDSLWEAYETQSDGNKNKNKNKKVPEKNRAKKVMDYDEDDEDEDEEEEEEEGMDGKLCCLQALKFSAGKMNLGMGRPSLVKISKAFKGIGWLHHVGRHGRKG